MQRARDMDLVRKLLLDIENGVDEFEFGNMASHDLNEKSDLPEAERDGRVAIHLDLLTDAGFVDFDDTYGERRVQRITWAGHEFIDTVRDPETWKAIKGAGKKVGSFGFDTIMDLGKAYAKMKAKEYGFAFD